MYSCHNLLTNLWTCTYLVLRRRRLQAYLHVSLQTTQEHSRHSLVRCQPHKQKMYIQEENPVLLNISIVFCMTWHINSMTESSCCFLSPNLSFWKWSTATAGDEHVMHWSLLMLPSKTVQEVVCIYPTAVHEVMWFVRYATSPGVSRTLIKTTFF